jgi:transposase
LLIVPWASDSLALRCHRAGQANECLLALRPKLEKRTRGGEQHLGSLGADKRTEWSVTGIAVEEVCDLEIKSPCNGEKLACRHPTDSLLDLGLPPWSGPEPFLVHDRRATRKRHSSEEKIRIVLSGLRGEESIAELCRREGIAQSLYYSWSKEFLEAGKKRLAGDAAREATSGEVKETTALKEVVAELMLENRLLKKSMIGDGGDDE